MPVLRSGARRGRANPNPNPTAQPRNRRGAVRNRRGAAAAAASPVVADENRAVNGQELNPEAEGLVLVEGAEDNNGNNNNNIDNHEEGVGERRMDEFDSGGKSPDKVPGAEDESLAPLPEKVSIFLLNGGRDCGAVWMLGFLLPCCYLRKLNCVMVDIFVTRSVWLQDKRGRSENLRF